MEDMIAVHEICSDGHEHPARYRAFVILGFQDVAEHEEEAP